ncbi:MAG: hypothetical protein PHV34_20480 [Verrucomicrobiae bacterium]|nr:hypothetical protein [Verrucomicrobiae bacterium]
MIRVVWMSLLATIGWCDDRLCYECFDLKLKPVLDGRLDDDPAWVNVPKATGFVRSGKNLQLAIKQTSVRMGCWQDSLFVGIECLEPNMAGLRSNMPDMGKLWREDSIEVFLLPMVGKEPHHFIVTPKGARWHAAPAPQRLELSEWQAIAAKGQGKWSVELRLPFKLFGKVPQPRDVWAGNFGRNTLNTPDEWSSCWVPLEGSFHDSNYYPKILFRREVIAPDQGAVAEASLRNYSKGLFAKEIAKNVDSLSRTELFQRVYPEVPDESVVMGLRRQEEIKRTLALVDRLSLAELEALRSESGRLNSELNARIDELKWKILVNQLISSAKFVGLNRLW